MFAKNAQAFHARESYPFPYLQIDRETMTSGGGSEGSFRHRLLCACSNECLAKIPLELRTAVLEAKGRNEIVPPEPGEEGDVVELG